MNAKRFWIAAALIGAACNAARADWIPVDKSEVYGSSGAGARTFSSYYSAVTGSGGGIYDPLTSGGTAVGGIQDLRNGQMLRTATSTASADMASASLSISANGSLPLSDGSWATSGALSTLHDTLSFHIPYGNLLPSSILLKMDVHAGWLHDPNAGPTITNKTLGQASIGVRNGSGIGAFDNIYIGTDTRLSNGGTVTLVADLKPSYLKTLITQYPQFTTITPTGYDIYFSFDMLLKTYKSMDAGDSLDASHTAKLVTIDVPTGVTWTSRSGLLLASAVPEPSTWAFWLVGLTGIGALGRKGRQRRPSADELVVVAKAPA
ncbi:PEP-CTERM sorting domain-containing protein [Paucibacter sp. B2R-40]|uniref:PEP-CTERM sorting domain-containing protein n=1 Tax=Paucibacter sp. B2R-40 TaxID=2893554 RepID=UPI0021E45800|nr:PEP-CTERM sorting domain-containing protein [Paucibacter sp. B2R-40]MCV2355979.1 PEP-CTERM sorting domain-containing protein [Paucibacter sp. B2R-40]